MEAPKDKHFAECRWRIFPFETTDGGGNFLLEICLRLSLDNHNHNQPLPRRAAAAEKQTQIERLSGSLHSCPHSSAKRQTINFSLRLSHTGP